MEALSSNLAVSLHDLLADLTHARRHEDLGRLALLAYCDVRRWARQAHQQPLAELSLELVTSCPVADRETFLVQVDRLIDEVQALVPHIDAAAPAATLDSIAGRDYAFERRRA